MPAKLKVRVIEARNLPVMDRASNSTDAYVQVRFGNTLIMETPCIRRTLFPFWGADCRVEVPDDALLQEEPLEFKVWDKDYVSSDDVIGTVLVDLNAFFALEDESWQLSGWFPIADSTHGIRGELHISLKLESFMDPTSPTGIVFSTANVPPACWELSEIVGFVEELIAAEDPEPEWSGSRTATDARQLLFHRLSGRLRRRLGMAAQATGCNAVLGYQQHFDLEERTGLIVARGMGTACKVAVRSKASQQGQGQAPAAPPGPDVAPSVAVPQAGYPAAPVGAPGGPPTGVQTPELLSTESSLSSTSTSTSSSEPSEAEGPPGPASPSTTSSEDSSTSVESSPTSSSESSSGLSALHDRIGALYDLDQAPAAPQQPPEVAQWAQEEGALWAAAQQQGRRKTLDPGPLLRIDRHMRDVILVTLSAPPHPAAIGGYVSARAVKLVAKGQSVALDAGVRSEWWVQLREEIKARPHKPHLPTPSPCRRAQAHARRLACNAVLAYSEHVTLSGEVCVLSASGTAMYFDVAAINGAVLRQRREGPEQVLAAQRMALDLRAGERRLAREVHAVQKALKRGYLDERHHTIRIRRRRHRHRPPAAAPAPAAPPEAKQAADSDALPLPCDPPVLVKEPQGQPVLVPGCGAARSPPPSAGPSLPLPPPPPPLDLQAAPGLSSVSPKLASASGPHTPRTGPLPAPTGTAPAPATPASAPAPAPAPRPRKRSCRWMYRANASIARRTGAPEAGLADGDCGAAFGRLYQSLLGATADVTTAALAASGPAAAANGQPLIPSCAMFHAPYRPSLAPFPVRLLRCAGCRKAAVPEMVVSATEPPLSTDTQLPWCTVEARVCRAHRFTASGEANASLVSDILPFVEVDLHRQLVAKARLLGRNAIFGLDVQLALGATHIAAVATGTALFCNALPLPPALRVARTLATQDQADARMLEVQRRIERLSRRNRGLLQPVTPTSPEGRSGVPVLSSVLPALRAAMDPAELVPPPAAPQQPDDGTAGGSLLSGPGCSLCLRGDSAGSRPAAGEDDQGTLTLRPQDGGPEDPTAEPLDDEPAARPRPHGAHGGGGGEPGSAGAEEDRLMREDAQAGPTDASSAVDPRGGGAGGGAGPHPGHYARRAPRSPRGATSPSTERPRSRSCSSRDRTRRRSRSPSPMSSRSRKEHNSRSRSPSPAGRGDKAHARSLSPPRRKRSPEGGPDPDEGRTSSERHTSEGESARSVRSHHSQGTAMHEKAPAGAGPASEGAGGEGPEEPAAFGLMDPQERLEAAEAEAALREHQTAIDLRAPQGPLAGGPAARRHHHHLQHNFVEYDFNDLAELPDDPMDGIFLVEVDDDEDEATLATLIDPPLPAGLAVLSTGLPAPFARPTVCYVPPPPADPALLTPADTPPPAAAPGLAPMLLAQSSPGRAPLALADAPASSRSALQPPCTPQALTLRPAGPAAPPSHVPVQHLTAVMQDRLRGLARDVANLRVNLVAPDPHLSVLPPAPPSGLAPDMAGPPQAPSALGGSISGASLPSLSCPILPSATPALPPQLGSGPVMLGRPVPFRPLPMVMAAQLGALPVLPLPGPAAPAGLQMPAPPSAGSQGAAFAEMVQAQLDAALFRYRRMAPCVLSTLRWRLVLPGPGQVQLILVAAASAPEIAAAPTTTTTTSSSGALAASAASPSPMPGAVADTPLARAPSPPAGGLSAPIPVPALRSPIPAATSGLSSSSPAPPVAMGQLVSTWATLQWYRHLLGLPAAWGADQGGSALLQPLTRAVSWLQAHLPPSVAAAPCGGSAWPQPPLPQLPLQIRATSSSSLLARSLGASAMPPLATAQPPPPAWPVPFEAIPTPAPPSPASPSGRPIPLTHQQSSPAWFGRPGLPATESPHKAGGRPPKAPHPHRPHKHRHTRSLSHVPVVDLPVTPSAAAAAAATAATAAAAVSTEATAAPVCGSADLIPVAPVAPSTVPPPSAPPLSIGRQPSTPHSLTSSLAASVAPSVLGPWVAQACEVPLSGVVITPEVGSSALHATAPGVPTPITLIPRISARTHTRTLFFCSAHSTVLLVASHWSFDRQAAVPGQEIRRTVGPLALHLIREGTALREREDGQFVSLVLAEALASARAHVAALGANALVGFRIVECRCTQNLHKTQMHCVVSLLGDIVLTGPAAPAPAPVSPPPIGLLDRAFRCLSAAAWTYCYHAHHHRHPLACPVPAPAAAAMQAGLPLLGPKPTRRRPAGPLRRHRSALGGNQAGHRAPGHRHHRRRPSVATAHSAFRVHTPTAAHRHHRHHGPGSRGALLLREDVEEAFPSGGFGESAGHATTGGGGDQGAGDGSGSPLVRFRSGIRSNHHHRHRAAGSTRAHRRHHRQQHHRHASPHPEPFSPDTGG
ncbi:hypothetical protein PAPYR_2317 [Paratrimastix pyriformis]|uniref:C2 domain-containing protein n=1 Tax=Paratrimastix pyriformis TaxID=342808 RepID=A0ABQ8UT69_9EUKA|nr:hypothetical protein PAPYR_2317 [Paratrimastix pyriformis]